MPKGWWLTCAILLCTVPVWADCEKTKSDYDVIYCSTKSSLQVEGP